MPITGVFRITHIKWTDGYKNALVVLKFNRFPTCTHMKIMLRSITDDMAGQLPKKYLKMLKKIQETLVLIYIIRKGWCATWKQKVFYEQSWRRLI